MNNQSMEEWYRQECEKAKQGDASRLTPLHQKIIAFSLFFLTPVGLSGCSSTPIQPAQPMQNHSTVPPSSSGSTLTAFDECEWERETNGLEIDCGNSDMDWYRDHGYTTKHSYVPSTSLFYRKMRGSEVPSSSANKVMPESSSKKPVSTTTSVSSSGKSAVQGSPSLSPPSPARAGGVGSGGSSSGGFSTGG